MFILKNNILVFTILSLISCQKVEFHKTIERQTAVPLFSNIVLIIFENRNIDDVIGNPDMPNINKLVKENTHLSNYFAITHPSLPNYISLMGGDTFGITEDCTDCFVNAPSLPDLIEASGRTWKTYQEDIPSPCYLGDEGLYVQKHNPFVYFDPMRLDARRCERSVVSFKELKRDIYYGVLPNFIFITPNMCHNAHDCPLSVADKWLGEQLDLLIPPLEELSSDYLVVILFDEGDQDSVLDDWNGGNVPVVLISPHVKRGFVDDEYYSHYSLLKTISDSWGLGYLGRAADKDTNSIQKPWK